jgi:hypothetical protein
MSFENQNVPLPPEREAAFLANAEAATNEASQPVIKELGGFVVSAAEDALTDYTPGGPVDQAEALTAIDARSSEVVEGADTYRKTHDLSKLVINDATSALAEYNGQVERMRSSTPWDKTEPARTLPSVDVPRDEPSFTETPKEYATPVLDKSLLDRARREQEQLGRVDIEPKIITEKYHDVVSEASGTNWRQPDTKIEDFTEE